MRAVPGSAAARGRHGEAQVVEMSTTQTITRKTPIADLPEFLSPEEFRDYVGIGRSTIYDLLRRDEIPHVKFGRCIRIPKTALRSAQSGVK